MSAGQRGAGRADNRALAWCYWAKSECVLSHHHLHHHHSSRSAPHCRPTPLGFSLWSVHSASRLLVVSARVCHACQDGRCVHARPELSITVTFDPECVTHHQHCSPLVNKKHNKTQVFTPSLLWLYFLCSVFPRLFENYRDFFTVFCCQTFLCENYCFFLRIWFSFLCIFPPLCICFHNLGNSRMSKFIFT